MFRNPGVSGLGLRWDDAVLAPTNSPEAHLPFPEVTCLPWRLSPLLPSGPLRWHTSPFPILFFGVCTYVGEKSVYSFTNLTFVSLICSPPILNLRVYGGTRPPPQWMSLELPTR